MGVIIVNYIPNINDFLALINYHSITSSKQFTETVSSIEKIFSMHPGASATDYSLADLRELCDALYHIPILCNIASQNDIFDRVSNYFTLDSLFPDSIEEISSYGYIVDDYSMYRAFIACYCLLKKAVTSSEMEILPLSNNLSLDNEKFDSISSGDYKLESSDHRLELSDYKLELSDHKLEPFDHKQEPSERTFFRNSLNTNEKNENTFQNQLEHRQVHQQLSGHLKLIYFYFLYSCFAQTFEKENHLAIMNIFSGLLSAILVFLMKFGDDQKFPQLHDVAKCLADFISNRLTIHSRGNTPGKAYILNKILIRRFYIAARICDPTIIGVSAYPESALSIAKILRSPDIALWSPDTTKILMSMADSVMSIQTALSLYKLPEQLVYYTSLPTFHYLLPQKNQIKKLKDSATNDQERIEIVQSLLRPSIMSVSTMNDPEEGYYIQDYLAGNLGNQRIHHNFWWNDNEEPDYVYNNNVQVFCRCFSPAVHKDDLSMWEIYGDRAQGCCAVVNCDLSNLLKEELFQICYCDFSNRKINLSLGSEPAPGSLNVVDEEIRNLRKDIQKLNTMAKQCPDLLPNIKRTVRRLLLGIAYLFKDASYAHEKEIRYLKYYISETPQDIHDDIEYIERNYGDSKMPLLCITSPFQLVFDEVMLGPKVQESNIAAAYLEYSFLLIRKYAPDKYQEFKAHTTKITKSRIKYR